MKKTKMNKIYDCYTRKQLIERCEYLQRSCERKEGRYVLLEQDLDLLQQSIASYVEIVLHQRKTIDRLTAESTKWESKFYDEAKKVDKAIEYIEERKNLNWYADGVFVYELLNILRGDKE